MIKAVSDRIVLIPESIRDQVDGIYIPDTSIKKPQKGTVVSVGEACKEVKEGYEIWFLEGHGVMIEDKLIITEKDVLGYNLPSTTTAICPYCNEDFETDSKTMYVGRLCNKCNQD